MSKFIDTKFCELPATPWGFDMEKFKAKDEKQIKLYKENKTPNRKKLLTYDDITDEDKPAKNYARVVPEDCVFLDFDNLEEGEEIKKIIEHNRLNCLELKTQRGYQFLFRKPDFYSKEMTGATNWFGFKFDTKGPAAVQIIRVCGMDRKEVYSLDLDTPVLLDKIDIDKLDVLPYWLWGKVKDKDLHKEGKTGDRTKDDAVEYTLKDNPFTQLMKMKEGSRHNHIVERCSYFALSNGFEIDEFKSLITAIHDQYLCKIGTPMPDSDLFGDLEDRWTDYEELLESSGWTYDEKKRKWKEVTKKKDEKIDERRAAEWLFTQYDFYGVNPRTDGTFRGFLYRDKDGEYNYQSDVTKLRKLLKDYSDQNFKDTFFKEMEVQLMQICAENNKIIARNDKYVIAKNKVLSCISPEAFDFSWLDTKPPTDVVLPWNWYSQEWVDEHEEDLGKNITWFMKQLSRDASGKPQPEVEQWLWVIAGASMIPANQLQKIVILAGGGQNGKSLFTSLIKLCLGEDMFNTSRIFDSNPQDSFWGAELDKGILCVIDDLPQRYNRDAFSYIKGAVTGTDTVEINEKFKPKRRLDVLPQIIASTNFDFKLYDTSEGMKRRVIILPTEFHIPDDVKDVELQHKLVLNTTDEKAIAEYKMSNGVFEKQGKKIMNMCSKETGVLESLKDGSLAWFANKARYMYIKYLFKELKLEDSEDMKRLFEETFENNPEGLCKKFIKWYIEVKCADCTDLSLANCFFYELYDHYKKYCNEESLEIMGRELFNKHCGSVVKKHFKVKKKKNEEHKPYKFILFCEQIAPF